MTDTAIPPVLVLVVIVAALRRQPLALIAPVALLIVLYATSADSGALLTPLVLLGALVMVARWLWRLLWRWLILPGVALLVVMTFLSVTDTYQRPHTRGVPRPQTPPTVVPGRGPASIPPPPPVAHSDDEDESFIYRSGGHRVKAVALHRPQDWETGLSFSASCPAGETCTKFRTSTLQAHGYIVRPDGGTPVTKLWTGVPVLDPETGRQRMFGTGHVTVYHSDREYWNQWHEADKANAGTAENSWQVQALYALREP